MKKNKMLWLVGIVLLMTAAAAVLHLTTRTEVPEGQLLVACDGKETEIAISELKLQTVQGTISNAKGDKREINAQGVPVADVLEKAGAENFSAVAVAADDEYRAELTAEEAADRQNVFFILQEEGGVQLIVFTDNNSKRNVSNAVRLEVS